MSLLPLWSDQRGWSPRPGEDYAADAARQEKAGLGLGTRGRAGPRDRSARTVHIVRRDCRPARGAVRGAVRRGWDVISTMSWQASRLETRSSPTWHAASWSARDSVGLTRFRGHPESHGSAVGVLHGEVDEEDAVEA